MSMVFRYLKKIKLYIAMMIVICMLLPYIGAYAAPFDVTHLGSISMTLRTSGKKVPVPGAEFHLYRVTDCVMSGGAIEHIIVSEFAGAEIDLLKIDTKEMADKAAKYAVEKSCSHETAVTDSEGRFTKSDLVLGVYLVVQANEVKGFTKAAPFFITVGIIEDGEPVYDMDATPKVVVNSIQDPPGGGHSPTPTPTSTPTPVSPSEIPSPTVPASETLAQTGQTQWPVPFLACVGLGLVMSGLMIKTKKDEEEQE